MIELLTADGCTRLTLCERIRFPSFADLHAGATVAAGAGTDVELDLGAAEHLHAGVVQILVALARAVEANGRRCRIIAASPEAADALRFTGVNLVWKETES